MNLNKLKKLVAALLCGAIFAVVAHAQPAGAPDAEVLPDGSLKLPDGTIIPVPEGTVDGSGNLVVGGVTIPKPTATLLPNGNLDLGDGTILTVPALPKGGEFIVSWFGADLFDFNAALPATTSQWYFSFTLKTLYHFAADNWFYLLPFDATFYFKPESGNKSLPAGTWVYTNNLFPGQTSGTWIWMSAANGFRDLRDSNGDGVLDLPDSEAGAQALNGFMYIKNPSGYPTTQEGFFFFGEFNDGNYIWRVGDIANAIKLRDPS